MRDPNRFDGQDPWIVPPRSFGETASDAERFRYLLRYAVLAPSSHNSQPWLFRIAADALELYADRSRRLPVADPDDRELTISCGAALFNLRLAMRCFGAEARVQLLPDTRRPDLLARVQFGDTRPRDEADERMLTAIVSRRTNRGAFEFRPVPQAILGDLQDCAYREGAWLRTLTDVDELDAIAELVAEADRRQATDPAFRAELARWVHPDRAATRDGMPGYALGIGGLSSHAAPLILRTFDWGDGKAAHDRQIIAGGVTG